MSRRWWAVLLGSAALWAIGIGWIQWLKFHAFGYNGMDLAIYQQAVWALAHGHGFASSIHDPSYLGDHMELWLIPLSWLYRVFPSILTLLWTQTIVLAISVVPFALLAKKYLGPRLAILAAALFLLHPLLYNIGLYEFHGLVFALPLVLWSIVAYEGRHYRLWIVVLLLTLAVREDLPFVILGWAALAAIDRRGWRWWLVPAVMGTLWFVVAQKVIGAHNFVPGYKFLAFYRWLGDSYGQMITFPFRHPLVFLKHVFGLQNWVTVVGLLAGFGFLPLFRPKMLWPLVFAFLNLLVLEGEPISFLHLHYTVPFIPFLLWASLVAARDVKAHHIWTRWDQALVVPLLAISLVLGPLYSHLLYGAAELPWKTWTDTGLTSPIALRAALTHIQPTDRVLTTFNLLPNLSNRPSIYSLNYVYLGRRQYSEIPYTVPTPLDAVIIDWGQLEHFQFLYTDTLFQGKTGSQRIRDLLRQNGLQAVWGQDNVVVYRRDGKPGLVLTNEIPDSGEREQLLGPITLRRSPLLSTSAHAQTDSALSLYWRVDKKISKPLFIRFRFQQHGADQWSSTRLLGQGGFPADEWKPGQSWQTNYDIAWPSLPSGTYTLSADILQIDGQYRLDRWRQFLPFVTKEKKLGTVSVGTISRER